VIAEIIRSIDSICKHNRVANYGMMMVGVEKVERIIPCCCVHLDIVVIWREIIA